ncbi:MAG: sortase [Nocardioidaceae bacterium]|nr:sortase [Nocardioidaceae bacterium]
MTSSDVVTGGQQPARHHKLVKPLLGGAIGCLSFALVFSSGYLIGSNQATEPAPLSVGFRPPVGAGLPAADAGGRQSAPEPRNRDPKNERGRDREPWKPIKRFVTVEKGDSLWKIAASIAPQADADAIVERIIRLNSLGESARLEIGQRLAVPVGPGEGRSKPAEKRKPEEKKGPTRAPERVARPVALSIPSLGLDQDLVELNVIGGALQVPTDYADVGWWRDGPSPGAPGSAVLVGHVDSPTGPAVFYELSSIQIGDVVVIRRADGTKAAFRVTDATLFRRSSFPSADVYRERGRPTLRLVTCGGTYDATANLYTHNLVVTAVPITRKSQ